MQTSNNPVVVAVVLVLLVLALLYVLFIRRDSAIEAYLAEVEKKKLKEQAHDDEGMVTKTGSCS